MTFSSSVSMSPRDSSVTGGAGGPSGHAAANADIARRLAGVGLLMSGSAFTACNAAALDVRICCSRPLIGAR